MESAPMGYTVMVKVIEQDPVNFMPGPLRVQLRAQCECGISESRGENAVRSSPIVSVTFDFSDRKKNNIQPIYPEFEELGQYEIHEVPCYKRLGFGLGLGSRKLHVSQENHKICMQDFYSLSNTTTCKQLQHANKRLSGTRGRSVDWQTFSRFPCCHDNQSLLGRPERSVPDGLMFYP